jgi:hypothetical protein
LEAAKEGKEDVDAEDPSNSPLVVFFQLMGTEIALKSPNYETVRIVTTIADMNKITYWSS